MHMETFRSRIYYLEQRLEENHDENKNAPMCSNDQTSCLSDIARHHQTFAMTLHFLTCSYMSVAIFCLLDQDVSSKRESGLPLKHAPSNILVCFITSPV